MTARLSPYLGFRDQARAATTFYGEVLGATPTFTTFDELGILTLSLGSLPVAHLG